MKLLARRLSQSPTVLDLFVLSVFFGFAYFFRLGRFPLLGTDEARYLEIPREMIERGDFVTPTLNYVPYFEKPPLHYWVNVLATWIFGESAFAARFFGALWAVLGILMAYHLGRKLFGRLEGLCAAVVLGTAIGFMVQGRTNITDTTLTFFLCAALGSILLAMQPEEKHKGFYYHLFYICAALAVLAKGLIGIVLPTAIIVIFLAVTRRWPLLQEMRPGSGTLLFFVVASPWFILVSLRNPQFFQFFFIHEHFARYLTKTHHRYQPFWFYLPVLIGCLLPWTFFLPAAIKSAWREHINGKGEAKLFLLLWAGTILFFFSLSSSKLIPYILPVYPALALLVGATLAETIEKHSDRLQKPGAILGLTNLIIAVGVALYPVLAKSPRITEPGAILLGGLFAAQGLSALIASRHPEPSRLFVILLLSAYVLGIAGPPVIYDAIGKRKLIRDLALMVNETAEPGAVVASVGYQQELPLYTKRRVVVVGDEGELEFGRKQGNNGSWFLGTQQFQSLWRESERQILAVVPRDNLEGWNKSLVPAPRVLAMQGKQALITNQPGKGQLKVGMNWGSKEKRK
ncbi:glycosyltransferase family 39 protein [Geomesophilobacter sediminis]|uniref:Glycosyltransferase family 39 protein n=1 Tax=Geomesophilobacter sediminis TaxID=2798584 RepID=A0A8J7SDV8_9BACT|nr:glycosyltransferase family 39 protein [Geomesophilobacter sediminis]MBJ6728009.1 glycosyltransferase family 39 protein [Geomesophilobacter sediminis]